MDININLILILLLIHYLGFFIFKPKLNVLSCGIFGWSGKDPKQFNRDKFDKLGIYNVSRGRDSCGFTMNGLKYVGIGQELKEYTDYIIKKGNKETAEVTNVVIGHTRQASPGMTINVENVHPFGYGINKKIEAPDDKFGFQFFFAHNGTLKNHKELAKKYNISLTKEKGNISIEKSDSNILGEIIFKTKSFQVLSEYIGGAACAFTDTKTNILYLFKGASRDYPNYGKQEVERPLFYYVENKNSVYFSSLAGPLYSIGGDENTVFELEPNTVYAIKDGNILEAIKYDIDRSKVSQKESVTTYHNNGVQTSFFNTTRINTYQLNNSDLLKYIAKRDAGSPYTLINTVTDASNNGGILSYKYGSFYEKTDKLFTGLALNVKNIGIVAILNFENILDIIDFRKLENKKVISLCNDIIKKEYYFKCCSNSPMTGFNNKIDVLPLLHDFIVKENLVEEDLFKNDIISKYFPINPKNLDVTADYISNTDEITFIVDGLIVKNTFEFNILLDRIIDHYPKEEYSVVKKSFTSPMDTFKIACHFKYYVVNNRYPIYNNISLTYYDDYGAIINDDYILHEGSPYVQHINNGKLINIYSFEKCENNIYLTDAYKLKNKNNLLHFQNDIISIFNRIKEEIVSIKNKENFKIDLKEIEYVDIDFMSDALLQKANIIDYTSDKELDLFLKDETLNYLLGLSLKDIKHINSYEVIDSLLTLVSNYMLILNFFKKNNIYNQTAREYSLILEELQNIIENSLKV